MIIKCITLIQPWATLVALGEKQIETRSWRTDYRGQLGIHAGKRIDYEACEEPRIKAALQKHGIYNPSQLPTGYILAICQIFDCVRMAASNTLTHGVIVPGYKLSDRERSFGYYESGRFAWVLANIRRPPAPIPATGKQKLWNYDLNYSRFKDQEWA